MRTKLLSIFTAFALFFAVSCLEPAGPIGGLLSGIPEGLTVTALPVVTEYSKDQPFEATGIEVMLHDNGWVRSVTDGITFIWNGNHLLPGDTSISAQLGTRIITVSYSYGGCSFETDFRIDVLPNRFIVETSKDWEDILAYIASDTTERNYVVTVRGNIAVDGAVSPSFSGRTGIDVMLRTFKGESASIFLSSGSSNGPILLVDGIQTLVIDGEGLTLEGKPGNDSALLAISAGARLEMRNGVITGNANARGNGGGVLVNGGRFLMSGGEVKGNTALFGGGVYLENNSSFDMSGNGSISGNTATGTENDTNGFANGGGGVNLIESRFVMSGKSSISGNVTGNGGGGIVARNGSTVIMMDGSSVAGNISQNEGGGVRIGSQDTDVVFIMKGGSVSGNDGSFGGGVYAFSGSIVKIVNGIIYGMNAPGDLANTAGTGAALRALYGNAEYGTFDSGGAFILNASFADTVDYTIKAVNGVLK